MPDAGVELVETMVAFAHQLRGEGVPVGPGETLTWCRTMGSLDPTDLMDLYWAGRISLVARREDLPTYDRVFRDFFLNGVRDAGTALPLTQRSINDLQATIQVPEPPESGPEREETQEVELGLVGSDVQVIRGKAFGACTPEELAALRRIIATMRLVPPRRRTRRHVAARRGHAPDLRRTVRETMRHHGEMGALRRRTRRLRPRRLVLLLDVSGSMADHSRNLLQFAHSASRASGGPRGVEVFCFGTSLTRITHELEHRSPDAALTRATERVVDWSGGTRIGEAVASFVRDFGRRGMSRGAVVVICSDGLDRGDPGELEKAMASLARLSHAIVWVNPQRGADPSHVPSSVGMMVSMPYVDRLLSGHDLASLGELAAVLPQLG